MISTASPEASAKSPRRLALATLAGLGARIVAAALGIVVAAILARHLGPSGLGGFSLALSLAALATQFVDFGLTQTAVREMAGDVTSAPRVAGTLLVVRTGLGAVAAFAIIVLTSVGLLGTGPERLVICVVALTIPLAGIAGTIVVAQAQLRPALLGLLQLLQSVAWTVAVVVLAASGASVLAFGVVFAATAVGNAVIALFVASRLCRLSFTGWRSIARGLASESWMLGIMGIAVTAYYRLDSVIVYRLAGAAEAGWYAAAYRFLEVAQLLPATLLVPILPLASRAFRGNRPEDAGPILERAIVVGAIISIPVAVGLSIQGATLIRLIYGPEFAAAAPMAAALGWAFVAVCQGWIGTTITISARRVSQLWPVAVVVAPLSLAVHLVAVRSFGGVGAAWVTVATEFVMASTAIRIACRAAGIRMPWHRLRRVASAAGVLAAAALACRPLPFPVAVAVPGVLYVLSLVVAGAVTLDELKQIARRNGSEVRP